MRTTTKLMTAAAAGFALAAFPVSGMAQDYPDRTIEWIVPSSAGSGFDVVSRIITAKLPDVLGVPVVVQNIAGAGGTVGTAKAADTEPDGYTAEKAKGNVMEIAPGGAFRCSMEFGALDPDEAVAMRGRIETMRKR